MKRILLMALLLATTGAHADLSGPIGPPGGSGGTGTLNGATGMPAGIDLTNGTALQPSGIAAINSGTVLSNCQVGSSTPLANTLLCESIPPTITGITAPSSISSRQKNWFFVEDYRLSSDTPGDDTGPINRACTAAESVMGEVHFDAKTYTVSGLQVGDPTHATRIVCAYIGSGWNGDLGQTSTGGTKIALANGSNAHVITVSYTSPAFIARDIYIEGNATNQSGTSWGIYMEDCVSCAQKARSINAYNVFINAPYTGGIYAGTLRNAGLLDHVTVLGSNTSSCQAGLLLGSNNDWRVTNSDFGSCPNGYGFHATGTGSYTSIATNYFTSQVGIKMDAASEDATFVDGTVNANSQDGVVLVGSTQNSSTTTYTRTFNGVRFVQNGTAANNTYADLKLVGETGAVINSMFFAGTVAGTGGNYPKYNISIDSNSGPVMVGPNAVAIVTPFPYVTAFTNAPAKLLSSAVDVNVNGGINGAAAGNSVPLGTSGSTYNGLCVVPVTTGNRASLQGCGIDASRGISIWGTGTGSVYLGTVTNGNSLEVRDCGATCVDTLFVKGNGTAGGVTIGNSTTETNGVGLGITTLGGSATAAGAGGPVKAQAGNGNGGGTGGGFTGLAGNGGATGAGGQASLTAGNGGSTSGNGGNVVITAGTATSGTAGTIQLNSPVTMSSPLPVASGGTGVTTPNIVAGTNITVSGTWPNQTVNATGTSNTAPVVITPTANNYALSETGATITSGTTGFGISIVGTVTDASAVDGVIDFANITCTTCTATTYLVDWQVAGVSQFRLTNNGSLTTSGSITSGADLQAASSNTVKWSGRGVLSSPSSGGIQLGNANAASPVNQILSTQGSRGGTDSNVAGGTLQIQSGLGTGTGTASTMALQTAHVAASGTTQQTANTQVLLGDNTVGLPNVTTGAGTSYLCAGASNTVTTSTTPCVTAAASQISIPTGTATFAVGSGVTSVVCASGFSCNNSRGTLTIVGGTATTGTIATVSFSAALSAAPWCQAAMNGGSTVFSIGNGAPSTTAFTISAGISVIGATFNVNYACQP